MDRQSDRYDFNLVTKDPKLLNKLEKTFVDNVRKCANFFRENQFPMSHSRFSEIVIGYEEKRNLDFGSLDFFSTVEMVVHKKYGLELIGDLIAGAGSHVKKR